MFISKITKRLTKLYYLKVMTKKSYKIYLVTTCFCVLIAFDLRLAFSRVFSRVSVHVKNNETRALHHSDRTG